MLCSLFLKIYVIGVVLNIGNFKMLFFYFVILFNVVVVGIIWIGFIELVVVIFVVEVLVIGFYVGFVLKVRVLVVSVIVMCSMNWVVGVVMVVIGVVILLNR